MSRQVGMLAILGAMYGGARVRLSTEEKDDPEPEGAEDERLERTGAPAERKENEDESTP